MEEEFNKYSLNKQVPYRSSQPSGQERQVLVNYKQSDCNCNSSRAVLEEVCRQRSRESMKVLVRALMSVLRPGVS